MTYCLALRCTGGIVFLSDSRTNAGIDNISNHRKLHVIQPAPDRLFVLQSAGNLATTQEVLDRIRRDLQSPGINGSLATVEHLFEAALYIGRLSVEVAGNHSVSLSNIGADGTSSFILGGQIRGEHSDLMLVYPEGNYIRVSDGTPYLQIGESKYGKSMLDLAASGTVDFDNAIKIALSSMLNTARANLSVGPPYDLGVYRDDSLTLSEHHIAADSEYLATLQDAWITTLVEAIHDLPPAPFSAD